MPVAASEFLDSSVVIGGLIAIEGVLALPLMAITVTIFFVAYFIAYEPYRALYPDLIDDAIAARAQSTQAIWRGAGTGTALIGGGLLVAWGIQAPLLVCGGSILLSIPFLMRLRRLAGHVIDPDTEPPRAAATTAA